MLFYKKRHCHRKSFSSARLYRYITAPLQLITPKAREFNLILVNMNTSSINLQQLLSPLSITNITVPGIVHPAMPELPTRSVNVYATLMLIFSFATLVKTYSHKVLLWFDEQCSKQH